MPPKYVKTIEEEILYEYAKLISRSAFNGAIKYGFVTDRYTALKSGAITMSDSIREWQKEQELPRRCVFCGSEENLTTDHLIPRHRGGSGDADNLVLSCRTCNTARGEKGVFQWLGLEKKDCLHRLVAGKYLKELYALHESKGTLTTSLSELEALCRNCRNPATCKEWDTVGEISCFCLESVF
jgi:hypothetical protein